MSLSKKICISNEVISFTDINRCKSDLVSNRFEVSDADVIWWIEVGTGYSSIPSRCSPPEVKLIINKTDFYEESITPLSATINMKEVGSDWKKNNMIFANYKLDISDSQQEFSIDTKSYDYKYSASRRLPSNIYNQHGLTNNSISDNIQWKSKNSYVFDCSVTFEFLVKDDDTIASISPTDKEQYDFPIRVLSLDTFASLLEDDKFADFTFIVRDKEFKVHKCLLANASHVFLTMFTCGLNETKDNSATIDCKPEVFQYFLGFIYTNVWPEKEMPSICCELYELAHLYEIELLKEICLEFILKKTIDSNNALDVYEFACIYEIKDLLGSSWNFIKLRMLDMKESCDPKSLAQIKVMLEKKKQYEEDRKNFIAEDEASSEPSKKKLTYKI